MENLFFHCLPTERDRAGRTEWGRVASVLRRLVLTCLSLFGLGLGLNGDRVLAKGLDGGGREDGGGMGGGGDGAGLERGEARVHRVQPL